MRNKRDRRAGLPVKKVNRFLATLSVLSAGAVLFAGFLLAQSSPKAAPPPSNLNQLMRGLFFPHSNVVFATQRRNPAEIKQAPEPSASTDPLTGVFGGWDAVENSALMLMEGADLLMTPGRTCSNGKDVPLKAADWTKLVDDLREAGRVSYKAAQSKSIDKMIEATDVLNTSCQNCHNKYRRGTRCQ